MKLIAAKIMPGVRNEELLEDGFAAAYVQSCSQCRTLYRVFYKEMAGAKDTIAEATSSINRTHPEHAADTIECSSSIPAKSGLTRAKGSKNVYVSESQAKNTSSSQIR